MEERAVKVDEKEDKTKVDGRKTVGKSKQREKKLRKSKKIKLCWRTSGREDSRKKRASIINGEKEEEN